MDINECEAADDIKCKGLCINTDGSFMCGCELGFTLDDDGVSCNGKLLAIWLLHWLTFSLSLDVNECEEDLDGCKQLCANNEGSFQCGCREGYVLDRNGFSCNGKALAS